MVTPRSPVWCDGRLCRCCALRMCLSGRLVKHSRPLQPSVVAEVQAFARLRVFPVSPWVGPCTSRHQWHLSASFGNVIDICHPITSQLVSQHLVQIPCPSNFTKRDVAADRTRYSWLSDAILASVLHGTSDCPSSG